MPRSLASLALLLSACTLPNPQFDPISSDGSSESVDTGNDANDANDASDEETGNEASEAETDTAETDDTAESTTDDPSADLPTEPVCEVDLGHRLSLGFSNPGIGGNTCSDELTVTGFVVAKDGGYVVEACDFVCSECAEPVIHPLVIDYDLTPIVGGCVTIEASKPIVNAGEICTWTALSVFPAQVIGSPYFVAANSADPTPTAKQVLGGWPTLHTTNGTPTIEQQCTCEQVGAVEDCCLDADQVLTYSLIFNGGQNIAYVGDTGDFVLDGSILEYSIYNAMARTLGQCSNGAIDQAWKVYATSGF